APAAAVPIRSTACPSSCPTSPHPPRPLLAAAAARPACDWTSPMTAPTSTAGRPSRVSAPSRASSRRRWAGSPVSRPASPSPAALLATLPGRSRRSPAEALVTRLAGVLPEDVVVHVAREVPDDFDARFGAQWRRYRYRISDGPAAHDPLRRDVLRHRRPLDVEAMARASAALLGEHDFLSYCRPRVGASTVRELRELRWERPGEGRADEGLIVATVVADAFCHHMVRSLVGALISVGEGRRDESWPAEVLAARTREAATRDGVGAAPLCPPQGLTLDHVAYPPDEELAAWSAPTGTLRQPLPLEQPSPAESD